MILTIRFDPSVPAEVRNAHVHLHAKDYWLALWNIRERLGKDESIGIDEFMEICEQYRVDLEELE